MFDIPQKKYILRTRQWIKDIASANTLTAERPLGSFIALVLVMLLIRGIKFKENLVRALLELEETTNNCRPDYDKLVDKINQSLQTEWFRLEWTTCHTRSNVFQTLLYGVSAIGPVIVVHPLTSAKEPEVVYNHFLVHSIEALQRDENKVNELTVGIFWKRRFPTDSRLILRPGALEFNPGDPYALRPNTLMLRPCSPFPAVTPVTTAQWDAVAEEAQPTSTVGVVASESEIVEGGAV